MDMHGAADVVGERDPGSPRFASIEVTCIGIGRSTSTYVLDKILGTSNIYSYLSSWSLEACLLGWRLGGRWYIVDSPTQVSAGRTSAISTPCINRNNKER